MNIETRKRFLTKLYPIVIFIFSKKSVPLNSNFRLMETEQHEMYEYARKRIKQKKKLYFHFVMLFLGSIFLFIVNKWMNIGEPINWYIWVITAWFFIFILHFIKVFITDSFMNKNWEREQVNRLMTMQEKKIEQLKNEVENKKTI